MIRIQTGDTERIWARAFALDGRTPLTGVTDWLLSLWRESDGQFYDFNDATFKAAGHTTKEEALGELDGTETAKEGIYYWDFDTSAITNPAAGGDVYRYSTRQSPGTTILNPIREDEIKVGGSVDDERVRVAFAYDRSTDTVYTNAYLERNGVVVASGVSSFALSAYDADDNVLFTMADAAADAEGVFRATKVNPGYTAGRAIWYKASITGPNGTITTPKMTAQLS